MRLYEEYAPLVFFLQIRDPRTLLSLTLGVTNFIKKYSPLHLVAFSRLGNTLTDLGELRLGLAFLCLNIPSSFLPQIFIKSWSFQRFHKPRSLMKVDVYAIFFLCREIRKEIRDPPFFHGTFL